MPTSCYLAVQASRRTTLSRRGLKQADNGRAKEWVNHGYETCALQAMGTSEIEVSWLQCHSIFNCLSSYTTQSSEC